MFIDDFSGNNNNNNRLIFHCINEYTCFKNSFLKIFLMRSSLSFFIILTARHAVMRYEIIVGQNFNVI